MLQHFHYINPEGKDQGLNVRNRAKELNSLLCDVDKIRSERKVARANRQKYSGIGSGGIAGSRGSYGGIGLNSKRFSGSGGKFGGFGSDSDSNQFGAYSGGVYGDGGGYGGGNEYDSPNFSRYSQNVGDKFEEYQVDIQTSSSPSNSSKTSTTKPAPVPAPQPDLFSFDDPPVSAKPPMVQNNIAESDDFSDFQSAIVPETLNTSTPFSNISKPLPPNQSNDLLGLFSTPSSTTYNASAAGTKSLHSYSKSVSSMNTAGLNSFNSFNSTFSNGQAPATLSGNAPKVGNSGPSSKAANTDDVFGSLWTSESTKRNSSKPANVSMTAQNRLSLI